MENASFSTPPPLIPPPVITPPPPSRPPKSRGWMVVAIILIVLLGFSWLVIFGQAVSRKLSFDDGFKTLGSREVGPKLEECVLENNDSHNKIAVITVDGIITSHTADQAGNNMVDVIKAQLDSAKNDSHVKAVILKVDSPGGEVMASDEINKLISNLKTAVTASR